MDDKRLYYGHTKEDPVTKKVLPKTDWQLLLDHLLIVAQLAEARAAKFGAGKLGRVVGLAHDLGKYSDEFQQRLERKSAKVDHATAGAKEVDERYGPVVGRALAYAVAGHHGGLPDGTKGTEKNLPGRLKKTDIPNYQAYIQELVLPKLAETDLSDIPRPKTKNMEAFSRAFFIRMLFSCLVDADYLDTESFMTPDRAAARAETVSLAILLMRLNVQLDKLGERSREQPSPINAARQDILANCVAMAQQAPGLFTLTVPTGGGKTYSSLAFGLNHAVKYDKDRVIYVIPYTSIIEQNAQVFREALEEVGAAEPVVLEHHSSFEYPDMSFEDWNPDEKAHRLASENWDAPVVVTTAVQFFESLFANRGSRCRKLHNMVNSVIILDEAQMMPVEFLKPCLWALAELVLNYGATVVLCTATQPAVKPLLPGGLTSIEIMPNPKELQQIFKRVTVEYAGAMTDEQVAAAMADKQQVLTIVNTRRHARLLFDRLQQQIPEGNYHLSARMCPAHRRQVLDTIREALKLGKPCRVVATQLIEAGVDVDFPVVYRAAAGLDSIAQAAGRCNREGRRHEGGRVIVFDPEKHGMPSKGRFQEVASIAKEAMRWAARNSEDVQSPEAIEFYFSEFFSEEEKYLDATGIIQSLDAGKKELAFPFTEIAEKFQLIDSATFPVVVPWDTRAEELMAEAEYHPLPASRARSLQPYVVQIYQHELAALEKTRAIKLVGGILLFVTDRSFYDDCFGLKDAGEVNAPQGVWIF
ncbi:CRISPR-associated helicase Cas3' [Sporomusa sp.]|uniref:CRISPR-associated helicase Cas3' n=1 Tax=Sporomusa sp. TaxID=2078658 RepID=UPI002B71D19C|nr:CRISPR-associated helicase Cas3' [Sporomusa sp.]HWR43614.1 CRISPR-associated helicase Cas3' [Sporomusa sp.]